MMDSIVKALNKRSTFTILPFIGIIGTLILFGHEMISNDWASNLIIFFMAFFVGWIDGE